MIQEEDTYEVTILQPHGEDVISDNELERIIYDALNERGTNLNGVVVSRLG